MYFYNPEDRSSKDIAPGVHIRTFWGEKLLQAVVKLDANTLLAPHSHPHEQISYMLEGEVEFHVADESRWLHAGEIVVIPGGVEHYLLVGPQDARILDTFSPVREEFKY
jgi:quercetin dioxygenase-like cupin family protein